MKTPLLFVFLILAICLPLHAAPRTSENYSITAETSDSGGQQTSSASYTHDGSAGLVSGISSATEEAAKHGYIAQLFDVTELVIGASSADVEETGTLQLSARQLLDDATFLDVNPDTVTWNRTGAIIGVSPIGIATAGVVYQNSPASVQGTSGGFTGSLALTVLDTIADNFGSYAADGLGDDWQVQYFGQDNPLADPTCDADGDGHPNLFEFIAGLVPTDSSSRFQVQVLSIPGQPAQKNVIFSPRLDDRAYTVVASTSLDPGSWSPLANPPTADNGTERTVTDVDAASSRKFYRVEIQK